MGGGQSRHLPQRIPRRPRNVMFSTLLEPKRGSLPGQRRSLLRAAERLQTSPNLRKPTGQTILYVTAIAGRGCGWRFARTGGGTIVLPAVLKTVLAAIWTAFCRHRRLSEPPRRHSRRHSRRPCPRLSKDSGEDVGAGYRRVTAVTMKQNDTARLQLQLIAPHAAPAVSAFDRAFPVQVAL